MTKLGKDRGSQFYAGAVASTALSPLVKVR